MRFWNHIFFLANVPHFGLWIFFLKFVWTSRGISAIYCLVGWNFRGTNGQKIICSEMCLLSFILYGTFVMKYDVVWCKRFYPKKKN